MYLTCKELDLLAARVVAEYRENGCMSIAQIVGTYSVAHNLNTTETEYMRYEAEFWAGKKKSS